MLQLSLVLLLCALLLSLIRSIKGPGLYNRLLAINHFSFQSVMFIAIYGFYTERPDFLDIAIMYVLIGFVGAVAVLKYQEYRYLGDGGSANLTGTDSDPLQVHPHSGEANGADNSPSKNHE